MKGARFGRRFVFSHTGGMCTAMLLAVSPLCDRAALAHDEQKIAEMESKLVAQFCQEREWLRCFYEEPSDCERIVQRFVGPCLTKLVKGQSPQSDPQRVHAIASSALDCFNKTFEAERRAGKRTTPECKNAPAHLQ